MLRFFNNYILDIVFPRKCFGCSALGEVLCKSCTVELSPAPAEDAGASLVRAYAPFSYREKAIRKALWALKYKGDKEVARVFAALLYDSLIPLIEEYALYSGVKKPLLVPVPISRRRRWARGYNQAEVLARALSKLDEENSFELFCEALKKTKNVPPQATIKGKTARMKNIEGCFAVASPTATRLKGRDIIVLDDIYTTGATFKEARRVLKDAGARTIICVAIAH